MLMLKYPNVYTDTGALYFDSAREFYVQMLTKDVPVTWIDRSLRHQVMFGTNDPRFEMIRMSKAIEELGYYDPISKQEKVNLERADYWKSVGAQFTETVTDIIERVRSGKSLKDRERKPAMSKKAKAKAAAEAEAKAKAAEEAKAAAEAKAAEEAPAGDAPQA